MSYSLPFASRLLALLLTLNLAALALADNKKPGGGSGGSGHSGGNSGNNGSNGARTLQIKNVQTQQNGGSQNLQNISGFPNKLGGLSHNQNGHNQNGTGNTTKVGGIKLSDIVSRPNQNNSSGNNNSNNGNKVSGIKTGDIISLPGQGNHNGNKGSSNGQSSGNWKPNNKPHDKDNNGHNYKHYCHYQQCFPGWWYGSGSYCHVVVIPTPFFVEPGLPGNAVASAGPPQMILIANLPQNEASVAYVVNGKLFRTEAGQVEPLQIEAAEIAYDRGGGFGPTRFSLTTGTYEFRRTNEGWQLFRKTFEIALENRGAVEVFRFQADGKPMELPAGKATRLQTAFPLTVVFDQNGQSVTRQLADGTFVIAPAPESGKLDLVPAEALEATPLGNSGGSPELPPNSGVPTNIGPSETASEPSNNRPLVFRNK